MSKLAVSMSTDSFISALRRLIAIRGPLRLMQCDRGTNFIGAANELDQAWSEIDHEEVRQYLLKEGADIEFRFNSPCSSHMGGVWERQIRSV